MDAVCLKSEIEPRCLFTIGFHSAPVEFMGVSQEFLFVRSRSIQVLKKRKDKKRNTVFNSYFHVSVSAREFLAVVVDSSPLPL
jgi:hypothetical protein